MTVALKICFVGDRRGSNPQRPEPQSGALPLNYGHHILYSCTPSRIRTYDPRLRRALLYPAELRAHIELINLILKNSGREDSNLRSHGPKPRALAGLSHAPF